MVKVARPSQGCLWPWRSSGEKREGGRLVATSGDSGVEEDENEEEGGDVGGMWAAGAVGHGVWKL